MAGRTFLALTEYEPAGHGEWPESTVDARVRGGEERKRMQRVGIEGATFHAACPECKDWRGPSTSVRRAFDYLLCMYSQAVRRSLR